MCRRRTSPACRDSSRCCITGCLRLPARRARSSTGSTRRLRALVETEEVKQRIQAEGGDPMTSTPEEYADDIDSEETKWGTLIRKLNLKVE